MVILKRTTIVVADAARMMRFYRDILGWRVDYDAPLTLSGGIIPGAQAGDRVRLVIMGGADPEIGKIGLLEWQTPQLPSRPFPEKLGIGDIALVADVADIAALTERVSREPDARIVVPPLRWSFPAPDGSGAIELTSMNFFDPAGILHEVYYRHNRPNPDGYLIRRASAMVADNPVVIGFYRDVLGLTVHQDSTLKNEGMVLPAAGAGALMRFTVCRAQHPYIGMIGALQFLDPPLPVPAAPPPLRLGQALVVAGTDDAAALFARVQASGAEVTRAPFTRAVPKSGGAGTTAMISIGFRDPGGLVWEVNQRT
jgi:catechol 2,3-dioxygenase-like lactoylglutathione lyase family enzyme